MHDTDAFGAALLDWVQGGTVPEFIERDDGKLEEGAGPEAYLADFRDWPEAEQKSVALMRGRILDAGCGAGRVALELQERGFDVSGIDESELAVRAARQFGVDHVRQMSVEMLTQEIESWDSVVLYGNNFGIFKTPHRARQVLSRWAGRATPGTRIFLESTSAYLGGAPIIDRSYYRRNRSKGLAPGTVRFRIHYRLISSPQLKWLFVSPDEMKRIIRGTGWSFGQVFTSHPADPYVVMLERRG